VVITTRRREYPRRAQISSTSRWKPKIKVKTDYIWSYSLLPCMLACQKTGSGVLLGAFAKLQKAAISCDMSLCLSVRMEQLGSHWTDFHEIWYSNMLRKPVEKIRVLLIADKKNGYFILRPRYLAQFFLEWKMFQTKFVEKIKTQFYVQ
jgi:hypothetical protein